MTVSEYIASVQNLVEDLERSREARALRAGLSGIALIRNRVQKKRQAPDGGIFGEYARPKKNRAASGDQRINWTDTGAMMGGLTVVTERKNSEGVTVAIEPKTQKLKARLSYNVELQERKNRNPNIIALSDEEVDLVIEEYSENLFADIQKYL